MLDTLKKVYLKISETTWTIGLIFFENLCLSPSYILLSEVGYGRGGSRGCQTKPSPKKCSKGQCHYRLELESLVVKNEVKYKIRWK